MKLIDDRRRVRFVRRTRIGKPTEIVLHHSWTRTLDACISALTKKGCGTHYAIDRDGTVHWLTDEAYRVSHCVHHNETAIGIDVIRGRGQSVTDAQYEALNDLLVDLVDKFNFSFPVLHENIIFYHRDLRPTECPGDLDENRILF